MLGKYIYDEIESQIKSVVLKYYISEKAALNFFGVFFDYIIKRNNLFVKDLNEPDFENALIMYFNRIYYTLIINCVNQLNIGLIFPSKEILNKYRDAANDEFEICLKKKRKKLFDKREDIKKRDTDREMKRKLV